MTSSQHRLDGLFRDCVVHGYRLERILGSGAFGISYLAEHTLFHTWHVIKEYIPDNALRDRTLRVQPKSEADESFFAWGMASFLEEARLLHGMSHPHIVKVTDLFEANGTAYFVMPFLKGGTLDQWVDSHPAPDQKDLESLFVPLLEGLKYIHNRNLLHRDIKPENIFITDKGHPVLIDFGAARIAIGIKSKALTQVLTPHFAPIEQYASKGTFTPALDIYSLAGCMYYAITHEFPVEAPDRIQHDAHPRLLGSVWQNRYSSSFLSAIDKALSLSARDRFQDAFAFQKALLVEGGDPASPSPEELRNEKPFPNQPYKFEALGGSRESKPNLYQHKLTKFIDEIFELRSNCFTAIPEAEASRLAEERRLAEQRRAAEAKPTFTNSIGMEFVRVPAGCLMRGGSYDNRVTISKPFYLGKYEVSQAEWEAVMGNNPGFFKGKDRPVENVSWNDVQKFIRKLNQKEGTSKYRLPTEAEWEYAARAGSTTAWCFGDNEGQLGQYAWYGEKWRGGHHPVGQKQPNNWGLYDMHGNVWEWVQDWYGAYPSGDITDPTGPSSGKGRVARGGSWGDSAGSCRSSARDSYSPGYRNDYLGFRLAFSPGRQ